jgi:hypothetical protein
MNAAVWLGTAAFFTLAAAPAFFTDEAKQVLGIPQHGIAAMLVLERYFAVQYWCGAIALAHQFAEWLYSGRSLQRWTLAVLAAVFLGSLVGGLWMQPRLRSLHEVSYAYQKTKAGYVKDDRYTPAQREQARQDFKKLHGISMAMNLLMLLGLVFFTWRVSNPGDGPRFIPANKFRS